jgi:orotate phosphoribosyltransferase-like protein
MQYTMTVVLVVVGVKISTVLLAVAMSRMLDKLLTKQNP